MGPSIEETLAQANKAHQSGKIQEAEHLYTSILRVKSHHPVANYKMGILASSIGNLEQAVSFLKVAIGADPNAVQYRISYINTLIDLKQFKKAKSELRRAKNKRLPQSQLTQLKQKLRQKSLSPIDKPVQKLPASDYDRAIDLYSHGKPSEALVLIDQLLEASPKSVDLLNIQGAARAAVGDLDGAVESYVIALEVKPDNAEIFNNLGVIQKKKGDVRSAIKNYNHATNIKKDYFEALYNLGNAYSDIELTDEAIEAYTRAIDLAPNNAQLQNNLGVAQKASGKFHDALESFKRAVSINPNYVNAYFNMGNTFQETGILDQAITSYASTIKIDPNFEEGYNNLGSALHEKGDLDGALGNFRAAIQINPNYLEANYNLGNICQEKGDLNLAVDCYRAALKIKPDYTKAHYNLGLALQEQGNLTAAKESLERGMKFATPHSSRDSEQDTAALIAFGRSGSLFFHSLFDGHPEISTIPGIYFKGWFQEDCWNIFKPNYHKSDWRETLARNLADKYAPLFDPNLKQNVIGKPMGNPDWLAKSLGFTSMGPKNNENLAFDRDKFKTTFVELLKPLKEIDQKSCFNLIHQTFHKCFRLDHNLELEHNSIRFFHIHNPRCDEMMGFLNAFPKSKILYLLRNPVQSLESWMLSHLPKSQYIRVEQWQDVASSFPSMINKLLFPFNGPNTRGVRLEDVKLKPQIVMPRVANFLGISDDPSLYQSEFCGKHYWGPASLETGAISGFDKSSIQTPIGRLLGERDVKILETLFWPFSAAYGYTQTPKETFHTDLKEIRPWLDEPMQFEYHLQSRLIGESKDLRDISPYQSFHKYLVNAWNILTDKGTYGYIMQPLDFD